MSFLLCSVAVVTCLGDGKRQLDSKSVWDSTTPHFIAADVNATRHVLVSPSTPKHLDEIDGPIDGTVADKQLNLNLASSIYLTANKETCFKF